MRKVQMVWKSFSKTGFLYSAFTLGTCGGLLVSALSLIADGPPFPGGGSGGGNTNIQPSTVPPPYNHGQNLYLLPPSLSSNALALTLTNPVSGAAYDLLSVGSLTEAHLANWQLLGHFGPGESSFTVSPLSGTNGFFALRQSSDQDSDGIPDYLEDLNGNGIVDSGETDPNSATDLGLKVLILNPHSGSRLL